MVLSAIYALNLVNSNATPSPGPLTPEPWTMYPDLGLWVSGRPENLSGSGECHSYLCTSMCPERPDSQTDRNAGFRWRIGVERNLRFDPGGSHGVRRDHVLRASAGAVPRVEGV